MTYWETSRTLDPGKILAWIAIIVLALGLNLFIFGMLPTLIQSKHR
jgi:protein TonB